MNTIKDLEHEIKLLGLTIHSVSDSIAVEEIRCYIYGPDEYDYYLVEYQGKFKYFNFKEVVDFIILLKNLVSCIPI